jgi:hypothetical protein
MGIFDRFKKKAPSTPTPAPTAPQAPTAQGELRRDAGQQPYEEGRQTVAPPPKWKAGTQFNDKHVDASRSKDKAAGGAINQVDLLALDGVKLGGARKGFFKESKEGGDVGDAAKGIGIRNEDSRLTERSVASSRVAEAAGVGDVIAKTAFATHNGKQGSVSELAAGRSLTENVDDEIIDPGILAEMRSSPKDYIGDENGMDEFGGPASYKRDPAGKFFKKNGATELRNVDLSNPRTQKEMNDLQWVDSLTGQVDRHGGNIFVDPATGAVKGIDNDAAFGSTKASADPNKITAQGKNPADRVMGSHNKGMPTLIDAATAASIRALSEEDLRKRITPLLAPAEVENTIARLQAVKQRLKFLELAGSVVGGGEDQTHAAWGAGTFEEEGQNDRSYLGHAIQSRAEAAAGRTPGLKMETPEAAAAWSAKAAEKNAAEAALPQTARPAAAAMGAHRGRPAPAPVAPPAAAGYKAQAGALKPPPFPAPAAPGAPDVRPAAPKTLPPVRAPRPIPPSTPAPAAPGAAAVPPLPKPPTSKPPARKPPSGPAPAAPGAAAVPPLPKPPTSRPPAPRSAPPAARKRPPTPAS